MQTDEELTKLKTIADVKQMDPEARFNYLKACWGLSRARIIGRLDRRGGIWWLRDITDTEGHILEYPLADLPRKSMLENSGVYIANESHGETKQLNVDRYALAEFEFAFESQQERKRNPLLISAIPYSVEILRHIPADRVTLRDDGSISLEESIFHGYFEEICEAPSKEIQRLKQEISTLKNQCTDADRILELRRQEQTEAIETKRALDAELDAIGEELAIARKQRDREFGELRSQAASFRTYVKSQVEPLHRLELITDTQWKALFPGENNAVEGTREGWPVFDGETTQAIDHIQRYLFGKDIGYPQDLLANFHALLCTGDLIILSGLSGSGKTNLVKSYAEATGNEARIVPVKPNWTSAEDLIGFHNPLQRAYATTPFLDALFEAKSDPERLYIVCLDEMNLARVEYYFADFLSRLEDRADSSVELYPDDEIGHVLTELRVLMQTLSGMTLDLPSTNLETLLADGSTMTQLRERLGLGDGESFAQLHARVRRMVSGALTVPARLEIPANVRFVGAVNMDDTTHYLSPKVLDRAHVLQFQSPLDYWVRVSEEVGEAMFPEHGIRIPAKAFPSRGEYPPYLREDPLVLMLTEYGQQFLGPLGIELGMRPLRQAIHYCDRLEKVFEREDLHLLALNNLLRQKVFPRFSFDGNQIARGRGEQTRDDIARQFRDRLVDDLAPISSYVGSLLFSASDELGAMIERAKANDGIYNYWA